MTFSFKKNLSDAFSKILNLFSLSLSQFYLENPAMIYSLFILLGLWVKLSNSFLLVAIPFLILPLKPKFICAAILLLSFLYCHLYYPAFPQIEKDTAFSGILKITSIAPTTSFNKKSYAYKGRFKSIQFAGEKKSTEKNDCSIRYKDSYKNLPCSIKYKGNKLSADYLYQVSGTASLSFNSKYSISVRIKNLTSLEKINNLTDRRTDLKEKTDQTIKLLVKGQNAAIFLSALVTGNISDSFFNFSFRKTGLQHILAISGFHFSILILFFMVALRKILPFKALPYLLLLITNVYFLYIGFTPSIFRAYISLQIAIAAQLLNKKNFSINTLGLAAIFEVIVDPLILLNLGFQLSFLSVAAIFMIYPPISIFLSVFLLKRSKEDLAQLGYLSKIGGIICNFIRESVSLSLAINIALIPVLLLYFYKFPLISFIYNLFFPPLIFISIFLLAISAIFFIIHFYSISLFFGFLTSVFTEFLLKFPLSPPVGLEYYFYCKSFTSPFVIIYLCICFFIFITLNFKKNNNSSYLPNFI